MWFSSLLPISSSSFPQSCFIPSTDSILSYSNYCSERPSIPSTNPCFDSTLSALPVSSSTISIESILPVSTDIPSLFAYVPTPVLVNTNVHPMLTRSKNGIFKPKVFAVHDRPKMN